MSIDAFLGWVLVRVRSERIRRMIGNTRVFAMRLDKRLAPFMDLTAIVLLAVSVIPLWLIDAAMLKTLLQWSGFVFSFAAISVVISRIVMPQVDLSEWVTRAKDGNLAAGLVVLAVAHFLGFILVGMVLWSRS